MVFWIICFALLIGQGQSVQPPKAITLLRVTAKRLASHTATVLALSSTTPRPTCKFPMANRGVDLKCFFTGLNRSDIVRI